MKFRVPAKELSYALTGLTKVISHNATLPVLKGVRIEAKGNNVTLTATDLECFATYTCRSAEVQEAGSTVIADAKRLKSAVQNAKTEEAVLRTLNPDTLELGLHGPSGDRVHVLVTIAAEEWPASPDGIKTEPVDPLFLQHYRMLLPFSSTDSTRHILQSVCCEVSKEGQLMVATDGRRLTTANSLSLPIKQTVIVPRNKFLAWPQLKGDTRIGVHAKKIWMRITCGEWDASVRLIEGAYPNWRQVVPGYAEDTTRFALAEQDVPVLLDAVKTLPGADQPFKAVTLVTGTPHPRIAACDPESGVWSYQVLPNSTWNGDALGVTVNRDFLADAVKAGFLAFSIVDDLSPLLARDNGNTHVLMPIRGNLPPELEEEQKRRRVQRLEQAVGEDSKHEETPSEKPDAEAAPESVQDNVGNETTTRKERNRMIQPKKNDEIKGQDQTPDLWSQYQTVRERARELNSAITELGQSIKGYQKGQKSVRVELDNARGVLAKLQNINI